MSNFFLSNINLDTINNNYDSISLLKNINYSLFELLPNLQNKNIKEKKELLKINSTFDSVSDFKNDYIHLKSSDINFSLDMFFNTNYNNNFFYILNFFNYNKNINLNFKNYSPYEIIEAYKYIIDELYKNRNIKFFMFDIKSINYLETNEKNEYQIYNILKEKILYDNMEATKSIIDLYLKTYKNTPESSNNIFNYIYFLRKFPIFKLLILKYFKNNDPEMYTKLKYIEFITENMEIYNEYFEDLYNETQKISDKDIDKDDEYIKNNKIIQTLPNTIFNSFLDFFFIENKIYNINFLYQNDIDTSYNFLLNIKIPYNIKNINLEEEEISFFPIKNINIIYKNLFSNNNISIEKKYTYIFNLYFKIRPGKKIKKYFNMLNIQKSEKIYIETINVLINDFLYTLFFIYEYYNLKEYKTFDDFQAIFNIIQLSSDDSDIINKDNINLFYLNIFYIYSAFLIFSNEEIYNNYKKIIYKLKHFFYIFKYFKNNNDKLFPIFLFLLFSDKNLKFIKKYSIKDNNILNWLENLYDKNYLNKKKIIID